VLNLRQRRGNRLVSALLASVLLGGLLVAVVVGLPASPTLVQGAGAAASLTSSRVAPTGPSSGALIAPTIVTRAGAARRAANPAANIVTAYPPSCQAQPTGTTCQNAGIAALNHARAVMGLGSYELPDGFSSLAQTAQLAVLTNLDRATYGLPPVLGTTARENQYAANGITNETDPSEPLGWDAGHSHFYTMYASNWAAGYTSALYTYYEWMYNDGPGGTNIDCTSSNRTGCWGHRQNTLANFPSSTIVMGAAYGIDPICRR
jgi:hypothetical protein